MFGNDRNTRKRRHGRVSVEVVSMRGPIILVLAVISFFFLLMLVSGCGGEEVSNSVPDQIDLEPIVEVGAEPVAVDEDALLSDDLVLDEGAVAVFSANSTRAEVDVDFDLEGPWDFSDGPESFMVSMQNVDPTTAPFADEFPDATVAVYTSWEPSLVEPRYSFQDADAGAWLAFGDTSPTRMITLNGPSRVLLLPARVGDSWTDTYEKIEGDNVTEIVSENSIVAYNRLEVPAGEYDAYLLQTQVTATSNRKSVSTWDYTWIVPGIGRAAEIVSMPDEEDEVFDRAYSFFRLESFENA